MAYETLTIIPGNTYVRERLKRDIVLKSVSLTPYPTEEPKRTSVMLQLNGEKEITLFSLLFEISESKVLNMLFKKGSMISLSVEGNNSVDLLFYEVKSEDEEEEEEDETEDEEEEKAEDRYVGVTVEEGKDAVVKEKAGVRILSAAMREPRKSERTVLFYRSKGCEVPIATFIPNVKEAEVFDLEFGADEEVCIGVKGANKIDVLLEKGTCREDEEDEEEDSEEEEECSEAGSEEEEECSEAGSEEDSEEGEECSEVKSEEESQEESADESQDESEEESEEVKKRDIQKKNSRTDAKSKRAAGQAGKEKLEEPKTKKVKISEELNEVQTKKISIPQEKKEKTVRIRLNKEDKKDASEKEHAVAKEAPKEAEKESTENKNDIDHVAASENVEVNILKQGTGKLIGKKTIFMAQYTAQEGKDEEKKTHEESIAVRKMPQHPVLKHFFNKIKGTREGAVLKATETENDKQTEYVLNVGKIYHSP